MSQFEGLNVVTIDEQSSAEQSPYGIMTIDCSNPHEIDDGVFVQPLDTDGEQYRVGVCVVDASQFGRDSDVMKQAMNNVEAKYYELPDNEHGYEPMLDPELIHEVDFREGTIRKAMIVSFIVGLEVPPTEVEVAFGNVEVLNNLGYATIVRRCIHNAEQDAPIGRASAMIMKHLRFNSGGDSDNKVARGISRGDVNAIYKRLIYGRKDTVWSRGSRMNEAYMVGAGHLVGQMMAAEAKPAIYRVHDPSDETFLDFLPPDMATYSRTPGLHTGLNLNPYCRVTSPLRRLEDFMMHEQLWRRAEGLPARQVDEHNLAEAIQRLNTHVVLKAAHRTQPRTRRDTLGRAGTKHTGLRVISSDEAVAATA